MLRLNNKGQSLVMFVVLVPVLCLVFTLVFDVGTAIYEKNRLANTCYLVTSYGLDNIDSVSDAYLTELVMKNTSNLSYISVNIDNEVINIKLSKEIEGIMGKMFGFNITTVNSYYEGKIIDGNKKIERIK